MNTTLEKLNTQEHKSVSQARKLVSKPSYRRILLVTRRGERTVASYQETTSENTPAFIFKG